VEEITGERSFGIVEYIDGWRDDLPLDEKLRLLPSGEAIRRACDAIEQLQ
jgi:hypothetical protein